jgi:hypothetical protein
VPEPLLRGVVTFPSVFRGDDGSTRLHRGWRSFAGPGTMSPCDMKFNGCPVVRMNNPSKRKDSSSRVPSPRPEDRTPCGSYLAKNCVALPPGLRSKPSNKFQTLPFARHRNVGPISLSAVVTADAGSSCLAKGPPDAPPKEHAEKDPPTHPLCTFPRGVSPCLRTG